MKTAVPRLILCYHCYHCNNRTIEYTEFYHLMWYMRHYFEYWVMFEKIDSSGDQRLSLDEFSKALGEIRRFGIDVTDVKASFDQIDVDGSGEILFDEFCAWALTIQMASLDINGKNPIPHLNHFQFLTCYIISSLCSSLYL